MGLGCVEYAPELLGRGQGELLHDTLLRRGLLGLSLNERDLVLQHVAYLAAHVDRVVEILARNARDLDRGPGRDRCERGGRRLSLLQRSPRA
jgi:hypothetical protein